MKTKILILALLLLSCFSVQFTKADDTVLEPIYGGAIEPCTYPMYVDGNGWNPVDYVTVEYCGITYVIEFRTCYFPAFNVAIVGTYQYGTDITLAVNNPNLSEINKLAVVKITDIANMYLGNPNKSMVYVHVGSCVARFNMSAPAPVKDWGRLKLKAMTLSSMSETNFSEINNLIDWSTGEPIIHIVNAFLNCDGESCCRARYNPRYNSNGRLTRLVREELITVSSDCSGGTLLIHGQCAPNCSNLFEDWIYPTAKNGMSIAPNPSTGSATVSIDNTYNGMCTIRVFDTNGYSVKIIYATFVNGQVTLDLSALPNGTYIISIYNGIELISSEQVVIYR